MENGGVELEALPFALAGLFVQVIFMFKREWLFEKKSLGLVILVSAAMFLLAYILLLSHIGKPNLVRILRVPMLSVFVFYVLKLVFFKIYKRNPNDTFGSMDWGQIRDGVFNALFWFLGTVGSVLVTYKLLP